MCGIFGLIIKSQVRKEKKFIVNSIKTLAEYSLSRGSDSSGMVLRNWESNTSTIVKGDIPINKLMKESEFKRVFNELIDVSNRGFGFCAIGHARLVTNGSQLKEFNNQPVVKDNLIAVHNGIIVNDKEVWSKNPLMKRDFDIDTEVLLSLLRQELNSGNQLELALKKALECIEGTVSTAILFEDQEEVMLASNNGSIYYVLDHEFLLFGSEEFFIKQTLRKLKIDLPIKQIKALDALILNPVTFESKVFRYKENVLNYFVSRPKNVGKSSIINIKGYLNDEVLVDLENFRDAKSNKRYIQLLEDNSKAIEKLVRCKRCILPETFPFIEFDKQGVCNYCKGYQPKGKGKSLKELKKIIEPFKLKTDRPNCIVPFSGGRDSTFCMHIVKEELGLNPVALTYDWGMVTDLARRNIARVCGKLGVENVLVSANIPWKRSNIKKNILAWLKQPELGMIPLFMAGDKYFVYHTTKLQKQMGIELNIWGTNYLENTDFKVGFCGVPPNFNKKRIFSLSSSDKLKLYSYVFRTVAKNPAYINSSNFDSIGSFITRSFSRYKGYETIFDYVQWNEDEINKVLGIYNWEKAIDTNSSWRIGDGTAAFYNYIYLTVAGFSEVDTFRSNQIREGMIDREVALSLTQIENIPRYESIRWYLEILGLDFEDVIKRINNIPKLYKSK